jgi:hypothetical protein
MLPFATRTDAEHYQQLWRQIDRSARELESQGLLPRRQPANGSSGASYSSPFFAVMYLILGSRRCRTTRWNVANRRSSAVVSAQPGAYTAGQIVKAPLIFLQLLPPAVPQPCQLSVLVAPAPRRTGKAGNLHPTLLLECLGRSPSLSPPRLLNLLD